MTTYSDEPNSSIGNKLRKHCEEGSPVNEAYKEVFKKSKSNIKIPEGI